MEIGGKGRSGSTEIGRVRAALGKERRNNQTGGDWSPTEDDVRTRVMDVAGVYGIRKVEYQRPTVGSKGLVEWQSGLVGSRGKG